MEQLFIFLVGLLLIFAIFDLIVGVSNDAVNFLTSAVGAKAASFRVIMIVAALGVFFGASASGGMLEVAKRGVFNPGLFTFKEIMFIYVVVMLTDILLLDFFNSMRLPTSTTISIVFELLGASLAVSFLQVVRLDAPISDWMDYINTAKALQMIIAIFVSVAIAFVMGWLIQFLVRAYLTFDYQKYGRLGGSLFGGIAVVIVMNFIVNVGLKTSPLRDTSEVQYLTNHLLLFSVAVFALTFILFFLLGLRKNYDPFRTITLIGTFALAMAFASNDLVNFIGVPIAGYEAFFYWRDSGVPADEYMMEIYNGPAGISTANPLFLIGAGLVMVITLFMSKKARNVIQTTVDLSRQEEGREVFRGNELSRGIVRFIVFLTRAVSCVTPDWVKETINRRYSSHPGIQSKADETPAAFDLVRASVNLTVAAALISSGTLMKLPLSTTYVSFMVLMGTSLADRAWNRDSAVYRVTGVFTVIGGWFFTGITALSISAIFATITIEFGFAGLFAVMVIVGLGLFTLNRFTNNEVKLQTTLDLPDHWFSKRPEELHPFLQEKAAEIATAYGQSVDRLIEATIQGDREGIRHGRKLIARQTEQNDEYRAVLSYNLKHRVHDKNLETGKILILFFEGETALLRRLSPAVELAWLHVLNMHSALDPYQEARLREFVQEIKSFIVDVVEGSQDVESKIISIQNHLDESISRQVQGNIEGRYSHKNNEIFVTVMLSHLNATRSIHHLYEIATSGINRFVK